MDLDSFLKLEKRHLAEERQRLCERPDGLNSFTPITKINNCVDPDVEKPLQPSEEETLNKNVEDWYNKQYNFYKTEDNKSTSKGARMKHQDDMEQWVSDTFYSYFPGFNNECQKRQSELQRRQQENQQNLVKHQMLNNDQTRKKKYFSKGISNNNNTHLNKSLTSEGENGSPNYELSKHSNGRLRPDSARSRLLQDLRHTDLTNFANDSSEDATELSRRQAEIEYARKKEYQRELMQQIEEKRRTIKLLRDNERQQEEVLTRRLQDQLKTIKLEEQLEKEKITASKIRFDTQKNRLKREQLLAKLENDSQLTPAYKDLSANNFKKLTRHNKTDKENVPETDPNKVYKYFSNSETYGYCYRNKPSSLSSEIDLDVDYTEIEKIERECYHLSEKVCPMCDEPLKKLENFCLRCQTKILFRMRSPMARKNTVERCSNQKTKIDDNDSNENSPSLVNDSKRSFFLLCMKCECLYSWCKSCIKETDVCKACQNKRNLCITCRQTLCSFCLKEVACGRDSENVHINDIKERDDAIEMHIPVINNRNECIKNDNKSSDVSTFSVKCCALNNLNYANESLYPVNIDPNPLLNDNKPLSLCSKNNEKNFVIGSGAEKEATLYNNDYFLNTWDNYDENIEKLRCETDKKLIGYLKNYGDLAYQTRSTQTTPTTTVRRDIVLQAENNLFIPLLREMPKMTRAETNNSKHSSNGLKNLQRRWDIPAVQKYIISPSSPKVVTQVGAFKKQLQIDELFLEDRDC